MPIRRAEARWEGGLREGRGTMKMNHGFEEPYTFESRFRRGPGSNPEELIGAALAGCYSMALAHELSKKGLWPKQIHTTAKVHLDEADHEGFRISRIELETEGDVPEIGLTGFEEEAEHAVEVCPVANALEGVDIRVRAALMGEVPPRHGD